MNPSTRKALQDVEKLLAQAPQGMEFNVIHLPLEYNPHISAILDRWPHLRVRTGSQEVARGSRR